MNVKPADTQCSVFLHVVRQEAQRVFSNMQMDESDEDRIEPLVKAFKEYCIGKENIIIIRYRFNTHTQGSEDTATFIN